MEYSGAGGKLIHEKNQKQKISWHCPFNMFIKKIWFWYSFLGFLKHFSVSCDAFVCKPLLWADLVPISEAPLLEVGFGCFTVANTQCCGTETGTR